jgi:hypothetical protein
MRGIEFLAGNASIKNNTHCSLRYELRCLFRFSLGKRNAVPAVFHQRENAEKNAQLVPVNTLPGNIVLNVSNSPAGGCNSWMQDTGRIIV